MSRDQIRRRNELEDQLDGLKKGSESTKSQSFRDKAYPILLELAKLYREAESSQVTDAIAE